ncbi:MAG: hypothetical protein IVW57_02915 [Ktedonobacterales bacterium]|nr:hypothetical protein [Ktedonobacterales bacterium]
MGTSNGDEANSSGLVAKLKEAIKTLQDSQLGKGAGRYVQGEFERILGSQQQQYREMDPSRAQALSINLHKLLDTLISSCEKQREKLTPGKPLAKLFRSEPEASTVRLAISGLATITFYYHNAIAEHIKKAKSSGSKLALYIMPQDEPQIGAPPGLMGTSASSLTPEQMHLITERLRRAYDNAISSAKQIQADAGGSNSANPAAQDMAMQQAVDLLQQLIDQCSSIVSVIGTPRPSGLLRSGNSGEVPVVEGTVQPTNTEGRARTSSFDPILFPPNAVTDSD